MARLLLGSNHTKRKEGRDSIEPNCTKAKIKQQQLLVLLCTKIQPPTPSFRRPALPPEKEKERGGDVRGRLTLKWLSVGERGKLA